METLKQQFAKTNKSDSEFNEGYITWLEAKVKQSEEDNARIILAVKKAETLAITYTEDEVKQAIVKCFNHAFECIKNRVGIDQLPNHIIAHFEEIKKK